MMGMEMVVRTDRQTDQRGHRENGNMNTTIFGCLLSQPKNLACKMPRQGKVCIRFPVSVKPASNMSGDDYCCIGLHVPAK